MTQISKNTKRTVMVDPWLLMETSTNTMAGERRAHHIILALYDVMDRLRDVPERSPGSACSNGGLKGFLSDLDEVASYVVLLHNLTSAKTRTAQ